MWAVFGAFPVNGNSLIPIAAANRRMPCLKNRLKAHMAGM